jgi:hypothetical protein
MPPVIDAIDNLGFGCSEFKEKKKSNADRVVTKKEA